MDENIIYSENPPGYWIGNVFYSETIYNKFLENMAKRSVLSDFMEPINEK